MPDLDMAAYGKVVLPKFSIEIAEHREWMEPGYPRLFFLESAVFRHY